MIFKSIRKRLKLFSIVSSIILLVPTRTSLYACGWGSEQEELRYMVFNPNLLNQRQWWTYFYNDKWDYLDATTVVNDDEHILAKEWAKYAGLNNNDEDVFVAIFGDVPDSTREQNQFLRKVESSNKLKEFFSIVKACDSLASYPDPWDDQEAKEFNRNRQRAQIISRLQQSLAKENDAFLKSKYAYQILKMSFYSDDQKVFDNIYNAYFKEQTGVLHWWATHYKAVILERQNKIDSANYLHALVFTNSTSKMYASKQHFSRENVDATLALATADDEKAAVLTLAAVINPGRTKETIEQVYQLNPKQPHLPLLIIREINKVEDWIGSTKYCHTWVNAREWNDDYLANWESDVQYAREFRTSLAQWQGGSIATGDFLNLAKAYMALLTNDPNEAVAILNTIKSSDDNTVFQVNVLQLLAAVQTGDVRKTETQERMGVLYEKLLQTRIGKFESQKVLYSLSSYLREVFAQADMKHLAGLFDNYATNKFCYSCEFNTFEYSLIRYYDKNASAGDIAKLIAVYDKVAKNNLERVLLQPYANKFFFYDVLSVIELRKGNIDAAAAALNQIPDEFWFRYQNALSNLTRDPFKDVTEQVSQPGINSYNKREIVKRMKELQVAATNPRTKEDALFELANAWYNFSDHSWFMISYGYSTGQTTDPKVGDAAQQRAFDYYQMALDATNNRDRIAKITYMLTLLSTGSEEIRYARRYEQMKDTRFYQNRNCLTTRDLAGI